jgi:lipopolysaccharide biosynthesis regulator YciM
MTKKIIISAILLLIINEVSAFNKKVYYNYDRYAVKFFLNALYYENYLDRSGAITSYQSAHSIIASDNIKYNSAFQHILSGDPDIRRKGENLLYELFEKGYPLGRFGIYLYLSDKENKSFNIAEQVLDSIVSQTYSSGDLATAAVAEKQKINDRLYNFTRNEDIEKAISAAAAKEYPKVYRIYYSSLMIQYFSKLENKTEEIWKIISGLENEYRDLPYQLYRFAFDEFIFQKDYVSAEKILEKMNRITYRDSKYYSDNAEFLAGTGNFIQARNFLLDGISEYPENFLELELASLYLDQKDYDNAWLLFSGILEKYPEVDLLHRTVTGRYSNHGNFDKTSEIFEYSLNKSPDDPELLNNYAYILAQSSKDLEKALGFVEKALLSQPQSVSFLDTKAWVLFRLGRFTEAEQIMDKLFADESAFFHSSSEELFEHYKEIKTALGKTDSLDGIALNKTAITLSEILSKSDYILQSGIE